MPAGRQDSAARQAASQAGGRQARLVTRPHPAQQQPSEQTHGEPAPPYPALPIPTSQDSQNAAKHSALLHPGQHTASAAQSSAAPAHHHAYADNRVILAALGHCLGHNGQLKAARHPGHLQEGCGGMGAGYTHEEEDAGHHPGSVGGGHGSGGGGAPVPATQHAASSPAIAQSTYYCMQMRAHHD